MLHRPNIKSNLAQCKGEVTHHKVKMTWHTNLRSLGARLWQRAMKHYSILRTIIHHVPSTTSALCHDHTPWRNVLVVLEHLMQLLAA